SRVDLPVLGLARARQPHHDLPGPDATRGSAGHAGAPPVTSAHVSSRQLTSAHWGWLGDWMLIFPSMMSCLIWSISDFKAEGTFPWKSWNGGSPVPPFCRVPM